VKVEKWLSNGLLKMLNRILYLWDRLTGQIAFRADYGKGRKSIRMPYGVAKDYADIFKGKVIWDRECSTH
jgi:hypothetical protein